MKLNKKMKPFCLWLSFLGTAALAPAARANDATVAPDAIQGETPQGEITEAAATCEKTAWIKTTIENRASAEMLALLRDVDAATAQLVDESSGSHEKAAAAATLEEWVAIDLAQDVGTLASDLPRVRKVMFWLFNRSIVSLAAQTAFSLRVGSMLGASSKDRSDLPELTSWESLHAEQGAYKFNGRQSSRIVVSTIKLKKKDLRPIVEHFVGIYFLTKELDEASAFKLDVVSR